MAELVRSVNHSTEIRVTAVTDVMSVGEIVLGENPQSAVTNVRSGEIHLWWCVNASRGEIRIVGGV